MMDTKLCGSETNKTLKIARERKAFAGQRVFDLQVRTETVPTRDCEGKRAVRRRVVIRTYQLRWDARRKSYRSTIQTVTRTGLPRLSQA